MGLWHRIKVRLGLEDDWDDEYDDEYDDSYEDEREERPRSGDFYGRSIPNDYSPVPASTSVRRLARDHDMERGRETTSLRSVSGGDVATMRPQLKMAIVEPKSYTEAQAIADKFKAGTPVIMNMVGTKPELARRMIDFASGLTYGLDGGLQKVSDMVFMLTPANVDVSAEDKRRLRDKGLFTME